MAPNLNAHLIQEKKKEFNEWFFLKKIWLHVHIAIVFYYIPQEEEQVSFSFLQLFFRLNSEILFLLESPNRPALNRKNIFLKIVPSQGAGKTFLLNIFILN